MNAEPATLAAALAALPAGALAGWVHFASLRRVTSLLVAGRISGVALQVGRFALLGGVLWLFAQWHPVVLLAGSAGIMAGRACALRRSG
ncbi:hypothetical protein E0K89_001475 [Aquicoccus sp. SCR17]|nr:hypothetical protein [Carideicomes alvinocaridis]